VDISWNDTEAWTWKTDFDDGSEVQQTKSYDGNWLHNCLVASSPEAEVILIAHQDCYAVFTCMECFFYVKNYISSDFSPFCTLSS